MRVISLSFVFAGANIAFQGIFQALEGGLESLAVSVCRQFVFVLPVAWLFAKLVKQATGMEWIVFLTFPIAEIISVLIALLLMKRVNRKIAVLNN